MKYIDNNLKNYTKILKEIKHFDYKNSTQTELIEMLENLKEKACKNEKPQKLLPKVYAIVNEAVERALKITPFDSQMLTAIAMNDQRIVELPTGEGKTLSAVFVAVLYSLYGKGVHILTFNDYLAKRDSDWMGCVYEYLNIKSGYITSNMPLKERKEAYLNAVTYLTAKQAGFDYLNNFIVFNEDDVTQSSFFMAIVDEADSILIDEARIPLVIASDIEAEIEIDPHLFDVVKLLKSVTHYDTDEYAYTINLTEEGTAYIENQLNIENLYSTDNLDLLTKINLVLQAQYMLAKDVDYIVRDEKVLLVDEYTGRIISNRKWPDGLQTAVEIKENLPTRQHSKIISKITLQNFISLYKHMCGMTGTAVESASQFYEFYNKFVTVIPSNKPGQRIDHEDMIFTHKEAKNAAIIDEIIKVNTTGRPILVGMSSIEESEQLAKDLGKKINNVPVLNAKNDWEEAEIIARAGNINAVTISTNMAGRGVDILLGGKEGKDREKIILLGGLYVIGAGHYESERIDNQLRGRAGRQGDPGESRFFVSLEDDLIVKYKISESLPKRYIGLKQDDPLNDNAINKAIVHTQKVAEGQALDAKLAQEKYNAILEDQRSIIYKKRENILLNKQSILAIKDTDLYNELLALVGEENLTQSEKQVVLYSINEYYSKFLDFAGEVLDSVKLIGTVGGQPLSYTNKALIEEFSDLEQEITEIIISIFDNIVISNNLIDLVAMGIYAPTSTHTFMLQDTGNDFDALDLFIKGFIKPRKYK